MIDKEEIKRVAEAATPQDFDSAQVATDGGWMECPSCGGEGSVELGGDYLNYDNEALGVQFYGVGDAHVKAEAYYRVAKPAAVLELLAEVEGLHAQHGRDSAELRSLCKARDDARKERDLLKAELDARVRQVERLLGEYQEALSDIRALRKKLDLLKPVPVRTDQTTIGYTGCLICGQYTDHGGLQCPKLAARSLQTENQRVVPVDPIHVPHPLDVATSAPVAVVMPTPCKVKK